MHCVPRLLTWSKINYHYFPGCELAASARPAASAAPLDSPARPARPAAVPDTGGNGQRDRDPPGHNNGVDTDILIGLFDDQRDMLEVSCHPL